MNTGLDCFIAKDHKRYRDYRLGVLCNQASLDKNLNHASKLVLDPKLKLKVTCFIGPQHGIRGEKQDNMIESDDFIDPTTQLPVFSLYGKTRQPTDDILNRIDGFLVDLQDIGTRIYTFMYTLAYCMQAAKKKDKKVIVLDRPNPINGVHVEGNVLETGFASFVGLYPMATRHGMTMGELASMFNDEFGIGCDLDIVKVKNWDRKSFVPDWKRQWAVPSPNIPNFESMLTFPGTVHFEGTNISEGRGTTKPFEFIGAPFVESDRVATHLNKMKMPGAYFRPIYFQPTYQKCKDTVCGGVQIHITDWKKFNAFESGLQLLYTIAEFYPNDFQWKRPPYEYEHERMPIDLIAGTDALRLAVEKKSSLKAFFEKAKTETTQFLKIRKKYLIY